MAMGAMRRARATRSKPLALDLRMLPEMEEGDGMVMVGGAGGRPIAVAWSLAQGMVGAPPCAYMGGGVAAGLPSYIGGPWNAGFGG